MSDPPPIAYHAPGPWSRDVEHLRLLAIFHYIVGGLIALLSSCGLFYMVMGIFLATNPTAFNSGNPSAPPPPKFMGAMFAIIGGGVTLSGWLVGGLTIYSGRCIAKRVKRTFSMVIAGICCLWIPIGTTLGVFTLIVLLRPSVSAEYAGQYTGMSPPGA